MIFNGNKLPYVEVAYEFARNPSAREFEAMSFYSGHTRTRYLRMNQSEIPIPVNYFRRDTGMSWDAIKEYLAGIVYTSEPATVSFSFGDDKYYKAYVTALEFTEEHEHAAKGYIVILPVDTLRHAEEEMIEATGTHVIHGHKSTPYRTKTIFKSPVSSYEFKFYALDSDTSLRNINVIKINFDFKAGDTLEINYLKRSAILNGNDISNTIVILQSNFMELPIGEVAFEATEETEVYYNERYY